MTTMRRMILFSGCVLASAVFVSARVEAAASDTGKAPVPTAFPAGRYARMSEKSPFAPATPEAAPAPATPSFAENLYIVGLAKIGDKDFVTIQSRDPNVPRYSLSTGEESPDNVTLVKVDWSPEVGKSKATVKKGNETGQITFDQGAIQQQQQQAVAAAAGGQPGFVPQQLGGGAGRLALPRMPANNNQARPQPQWMQPAQPAMPNPASQPIRQIPRTPQMPQTNVIPAQPPVSGNAGFQPAAQPQPDVRRRSRIILNGNP